MPVAVELKSRDEIACMREAGRIVAETLQVLSWAARPGITTAELDRIAAAETRKRKAKPAFLGYRGFPATLCVSVNDEVVHGIPSEERVLQEGDLVSLDFGVIVKGYFADAAVTVGLGRADEKAKRLMDVTRRSLEKAIAVCRPEARLGDVSHAVQSCVEAEGFGVVREFVGHGIGRSLHEDPAVPNYGRPGTGRKLDAGLVIAIEPMVTAGSPEVKVLSDGWTAVTADKSLAAHFEHTVAVTENGPEVLTKL